MSRLFPVSLAVTASIIFTSLASAASHDWAVRHQHTAPLIGIAGGNNTLVAIGDADAKILWSTNGIHWQAASHQAEPHFTSIAFGNNKFVVGGRHETLLLSENGKDWSITHSDTNNYIWAIRFFNGAHVALARTSLLRSVDGLTWERIPIPGIFYSMGILSG